MTSLTIKRVVKDAPHESISEHREDLRDLLAEVIEDVAIAEAIREGEPSKRVGRDKVMAALRRKR